MHKINYDYDFMIYFYVLLKRCIKMNNIIKVSESNNNLEVIHFLQEKNCFTPRSNVLTVLLMK